MSVQMSRRIGVCMDYRHSYRTRFSRNVYKIMLRVKITPTSAKRLKTRDLIPVSEWCGINIFSDANIIYSFAVIAYTGLFPCLRCCADDDVSERLCTFLLHRVHALRLIAVEHTILCTWIIVKTFACNADSARNKQARYTDAHSRAVISVEIICRRRRRVDFRPALNCQSVRPRKKVAVLR